MDSHSQLLLDEFKENLEAYHKLNEIVVAILKEKYSKRKDITIDMIESRVKTEKSLVGKLERKGLKYKSIFDLTDLLGLRIITFYNDDIDKVSLEIEKLFDVDWDNSIDKRKTLNIDSFGYASVHYICRLPKSLYFDENMPVLNEIRFEIQIRTILQHAWAQIEHDRGYKTDIDIPQTIIRKIYRLAGLLELADEAFLDFKNEVDNYRDKLKVLLQGKKFEDILLDIDSYESYVETRPFDEQIEKVKNLFKVDIEEVSPRPYYDIFKLLGLKTLQDIEDARINYSEETYRLMSSQLEGFDLDIISSNVFIQNLCMIIAYKKGYGREMMVQILNKIYGVNPRHEKMATRLFDKCQNIAVI